MSSRIVVGMDWIVGPWVCERAGGTYAVGGGDKTIGLAQGNRLIAGTIFDNYNGANVCIHVASSSPEAWRNREFLWFNFHYAFNQLGCKRVTGMVPSSNLPARRFDEWLGFVPEATLKDAHPDGDLLVYVMTREQCRWLALGDRYGKKQGTEDA